MDDTERGDEEKEERDSLSVCVEEEEDEVSEIESSMGTLYAYLLLLLLGEDTIISGLVKMGEACSVASVVYTVERFFS